MREDIVGPNVHVYVAHVKQCLAVSPYRKINSFHLSLRSVDDVAATAAPFAMSIADRYPP